MELKFNCIQEIALIPLAIKEVKRYSFRGKLMAVFGKNLNNLLAVFR